MKEEEGEGEEEEGEEEEGEGEEEEAEQEEEEGERKAGVKYSSLYEHYSSTKNNIQSNCCKESNKMELAAGKRLL
ncbi:Hypothetical predicted protein [Octopus vulgaris]|uniref:Uncharacterized protein n=1 Tax=Octopus vulgaris TaxID=6645 RepID=A0AA36B384_OCTVU|nr:Hypothetical predicted protein [Octopus vulgaris]